MKIGLFAYGSIILNPYSNNYNAGIEVSENFKVANFSLPLSFSRLSSYGKDNERITLVPDENGLPTPIYCAKVKATNLSEALKQLKLREGTENNKFVSYIRKGIPQSANAQYKTIIVNNEKWSYRVNGIKKSDVCKMINYLCENHFSAGIITTFDSNYSQDEIKNRIIAKPIISTNTTNYYNDLPNSVKKVHKEVLKNLLMQ